MAESVREREQQAVVGNVLAFDGSSHLEAEATSHQHERDVVERVGRFVKGLYPLYFY